MEVVLNQVWTWGSKKTMFLGIRIWVREQWERKLERHCEVTHSFICSFNPLTYLLSTYFMPDKNVAILDPVFYWPYNIETLEHQRDDVVRNHSDRLPVNRTPSIVLVCGWEACTPVMEPYVISAIRLHLHCQTWDLSSLSKRPFAFFLHLRRLRPRRLCVALGHMAGQRQSWTSLPRVGLSALLLLSNLVPARGSADCPGEWWHCLLRSKWKVESPSWGLADSHPYQTFVVVAVKWSQVEE